MRKRRRLLISITAVILVLLLVTLNFMQRQYVLPIAMYHSIEPGTYFENRLFVSTFGFERQMRFLKTRGYNVISLEKAGELIGEKKRIPPKTLVITFDDGYKTNYDYAFPVLKKYNLPATIFLIVNEIGRPENDRLSWDEIKEMQASGLITFGSHALGPEPLLEIRSEEELKRQIFDSKKALEQNLGRKINTFSYPGGGFNQKIRQMVIDAGYKLAVTTCPGRKFPTDDLFALKRLRISSNCNNLFIYWVETSGFYTFLKERRDQD